MRSLIRKTFATAASLLPILALVLSWPSALRAHCDVIPEFGTLLQLSLQMADTDGDPAEVFTQSNAVLGALALDVTTARLDDADHSNARTAVTVFLQNMQFINQLAASSGPAKAQAYVQSEAFITTRSAAFRTYQTLCHDADAETLEDLFPDDMPTIASDSDHATLGVGLGTTNLPSQSDQSWGQLLIGLWGLCVFCVTGLHYALILKTSGRLMRHYCKIPAKLSVAAQDVSGHVLLIGINGAQFEPDNDEDAAAIEGLEAGMFCDITIAGQEMAAKTIDQAVSRVALLFKEPLEKIQVKAALDASLTPPKPDRTGRNADPARRYRFGKGYISDPVSDA